MRNALLTVVLAGFLSQGAVAAQVTEPTTYRLTGTRVALAQDVHIERDEEVTDVAVVVGGSLVVDGRVRDGIVVVGGNLRLTATSDVRGDIVLVGGQLQRDEGARHAGSVNYISFGDWSRRTFGFFPTFDFGDYGRWLSLAGTFARVSLLAVLMMVVLVIARPAVARSGRAAVAEPVRAGLVGLAAEIFFVPFLVAASIGLAITIVGIPFVALLVPVALGPALLLGLGASGVLSSLGVYVRDTAEVMRVALQLLFFLCPVVWTLRDVPSDSVRTLVMLNPLAVGMETCRALLTGAPGPGTAWVVAYALLGWLAAAVGHTFFRRTQDGFADVL